MSKLPRKRSSGLSRNTLNALDPDEVADLPVTADSRPAALQRMMTVPGELLDTVRDVFQGTRVAEDDKLIHAVLEIRQAVGQAWERAARSYLEIGRALNALDETLTNPEEQKRLKAGFERLFPFSDPIASQFRRVARMVDSGRVEENILPGSYSAAYQVSLLDGDDLDEAMRRGLIGPNASRSSIIAFRKERSLPTSSGKINLRALRAEQRSLRERRRRMVQELATMRRRAREITRLLEG